MSNYLFEVEKEQNDIKNKPPYKEVQYSGQTMQERYQEFIDHIHNFERSPIQDVLRFAIT